MDTQLLLSRWQLELLHPEDVPALAVQALAEGCTASELAVLATLTRPTRADVDEHLPSLLNRIGADRPSSRLALKVVIDDYAKRIAEGRIEACLGAREISAFAWDMEPRLFSQVAIYVGLASEWDGFPTERLAIDEQIIKESRQFVEAGGLRIDI